MSVSAIKSTSCAGEIKRNQAVSTADASMLIILIQDQVHPSRKSTVASAFTPSCLSVADSSSVHRKPGAGTTNGYFSQGPQPSQYSNKRTRTHVAMPKGEGWEGTKAAAAPTRARRARTRMVPRGEKFQRVVMTGWSWWHGFRTAVVKRDQSKCVMPAYFVVSQ